MYGKMMSQGGGSFGNVLVAYISATLVIMLARRVFEITNNRDVDIESQGTNELQKPLRRLWNTPFVPLTIFLFIGSLFIPDEPWKRMRPTLLFDIVASISSVVVTKSIANMRGSGSESLVGSNPLGNMNYSPDNDPYYISNLDSPIDDFIASALEGLEFTNIVHIVLESTRADSYPFKEDGQLMTYIKEKFEPAPDGKPITASNISPFIMSLSDHTISWETMWTSVPFTHKAMLGRTYKS
jgi:hypothetical protein